MPDDKNSSLLSENIPSQLKARPVNHNRPDALSQEQAELVDIAQEAMTPAQQNLVDHHNKTVQHGIQFNNTPMSCGGALPTEKVLILVTGVWLAFPMRS
jgi:hypothetical protein